MTLLWSLLAVVLCNVALVTSSRQNTDDVTWRQWLREQEMSQQPAQAQWTQQLDDSSSEQSSEQNTGYVTPKRGISVVTRWKPLRQAMRNYIEKSRMLPVMPDMDFVSAETRGMGRPAGQPLRWGRR